ncbi:class C beta-lactamase-related serine hydrolase [Alteromonadaceae bacterium M269]|nr:class C beta-lactamase-related serine hydrolase [Alteromonadaceae bacterium M269]
MKLKGLSLFIVAILLLAGLSYQQEIKQLYHFTRLFEPELIVKNFSNMKDIMPTTRMERSGTVRRFNEMPRYLPSSFVYQGKAENLEAFLQQTRTTAFLVLKDDDIVFEDYYLGTSPDDLRISWSVSKSYLSAIFGIAVHDGLIPDLHAPVTDYVPELVGSGYDGVSIKNVLQMSTGVAFNEDYDDYNSDINRLGRTMALSGSFDEFAASLTSEREQGQYMKYVSVNTHVLGMVLRSATGVSIQQYLDSKLLSKLGNEHDASYLVDGEGQPLVLGGLNASTRDYAKLGALFRDNGRIGEQQIVPEQWIKDSVTPDAPHLMPGKRNSSDSVFGYGYQWWIPENGEQEFFALGIYDQFIYINQRAGVVIVKNSANTEFSQNEYESIHKSLAAFQAIADSLMDFE